nr:MAG TPA: hypothetical protein [Caudoviricetes sp.]
MLYCELIIYNTHINHHKNLVLNCLLSWVFHIYNTQSHFTLKKSCFKSFAVLSVSIFILHYF